MTNIVIVEGARTPFAKLSNSFKDISATELGTIASKEALKRSKVNVEDVDHVIFGNVQQSDSNSHMLSRHIALESGLNIDVPAVTINRVCGTGIETIIMAARFIMAGDAKVVLAGGTESMSQVPHVVPGMRWGSPLGAPQMEDWLWDGLLDKSCGFTMGGTAENVAKKYSVTREEADEHALSSHQLAQKATENGVFLEEIVPVTVKHRKGEFILDKDEHIRDTSIEQLSRLKARFAENGVVTPGNASGMVDGAAAVIVTTEEYAKEHDLKPIARLVSWDAVGVEPKYMGIGPVPAINNALKKANLEVSDLDLVEINEAFSVQYLACQKELGFDPSIGNVNGGAIAIGHPLAATGTRISYSMIKELQRRSKKYGVASACIGGGQGVAAIFEAL